jgi:hypothetical protein
VLTWLIWSIDELRASPSAPGKAEPEFSRAAGELISPGGAGGHDACLAQAAEGVEELNLGELTA